MQLNFVTVDVFTDQQFGGNPLAVVLNGHGLTTEQMQSIAEFNLAETTFVLPPKVPHQRRFTLHNVLEWWIGRAILIDKFDSGFRGF
jgi:PhzF family phenazine biosynthesis protein